MSKNAATVSKLVRKNQSNIDGDSVDTKNSKENQLKNAMNAADKRLSESKERQLEAEVEQMEEAIATQVQKSMVEQESKITNSSANTQQLNQDELKTERSLELRRKHQSLHEMRSQIQNSVSLLGDATRHSDSLLKYFAKVEIDLAHLEEIESKATKMRELFTCVSKKHVDMKLRISEQQKQIELLNTQKSQNRSTIAEAQTEFSRLIAELRSQAHDIEQRDVEIAKHKDDKSALKEKNNVLLDQNSVADADIESLKDKLGSHKLQIKEQDKLLSKNAQQIDALTSENEQGQLETKDLQTRFTNLNIEFVNLQMQFEESDHTYDSERKGFEEKQRHADARIAKLETKIGVLNKQLIKSEEKIATLIFDLEKAQSYRKNNKINANKRAPYIIHPKKELNITAH